MFRKSPTILVAALFAAALPGLSACGQKGDLVLPPGKSLAVPAPASSSPSLTTSPAMPQGAEATLPAWPAAAAITPSSNAPNPAAATPAASSSRQP